MCVCRYRDTDQNDFQWKLIKNSNFCEENLDYSKSSEYIYAKKNFSRLYGVSLTGWFGSNNCRIVIDLDISLNYKCDNIMI